MHAPDVIPDQWENRRGRLYQAHVRFNAQSAVQPFFRELLVQLVFCCRTIRLRRLHAVPPIAFRPLAKREGQVPSKRCYRRYVTMLRSQGISLAPENQLCGQLFLDRTSDKRQIRRAVRSALGKRGVSNARRSDNARKRYSFGFASVSSRGSETPNGKDVTVTAHGICYGAFS